MNWTKTKTGDQPVLRLGDDDDLRRVEPMRIYGNLAEGVDVGPAKNLNTNKKPKLLFQGQTVGHTEGFVLSADEADQLRQRNRANASVIFPYLDGRELLRLKHPQRYVIDFHHEDVALARANAPDALARIQEMVLPDRRQKADEEAARNVDARADNPRARINQHHARFLDTWWQHSYRRADLLASISELDRFIAVPRVASEDRLPVFAFMSPEIHPSDQLQCAPLDDDYSFGVLQSHLHEAWFRARCSTLEERLRYTTKTVWHSFPWPQAPSNKSITDIVEAAAAILDFRQAREDDHDLGLIEIYDSLRAPGRNALRVLHQDLDDAVLAAYGFGAGDPLQQLLDLNQELAAAEANGEKVRGPGAAWIDESTRRRTNHRMVPAKL